MAQRRRQSIICHSCNKEVSFTIDMELDGNHVFECPKCGHEHCRVVKNGEITDFRWDSRNETYRAKYVSIMVTGTASASANASYVWLSSGTACS
jgi:hypothetical protein